MMRKLLAILALACGLPGCKDMLEACASDWDCRDQFFTPGRCIPAGDGKAYCAYLTLSCPSQYRWYGGAPPALRNRCVDKALIPPDGGTDAMSDGGTDALSDGPAD